MNPAELELLRIYLLQTLRAIAGSELPLSTLLRGAKLAGFRDVSDRDLLAELRYLEDKRLVATPEKSVSPEMREWRITADGRDYLATRGL